MSDDNQKDQPTEDQAAQAPAANAAPAVDGVDEMAVRLASIEGEAASGDIPDDLAAAMDAELAAEDTQPDIDEQSVAVDPLPATNNPQPVAAEDLIKAADTTPEIPEEPKTTDAPAESPKPQLAQPSQPDNTEAPTPAATVLAAAVKNNAKPKRRLSHKQRVVLVVAAVSLLVVGGGGASLAVLYQAPVPESQLSTTTTQAAKMGVAVTVADGTVLYQNDSGGSWNDTTTDGQLTEGMSVKTEDQSRAVLQFDDGSALRLDAGTTVTLTSLDVKNIKITQQAGTTYSRVVTSERSYVVVSGDANYKAMGTAFSIVKTDTEAGVRVFQSNVSVDGVSEAVAEGKQYFAASSDDAIKQKITDINYDQLANNEFVNWNLTEDEKVDEFKDKLGVLGKVRERAEQIVKEQNEAAAKYAAETAAKAEAEAKAAAERKANSVKKVTRGTMTAKASGTNVTWTYTGNALHGYKLVYSKTSQTPTFGTDNAIYYSDPSRNSGNLSNADGKSAGTYYVRICAYTNGTEDEPCVDYSNVVTVQVP